MSIRWIWKNKVVEVLRVEFRISACITVQYGQQNPPALASKAMQVGGCFFMISF